MSRPLKTVDQCVDRLQYLHERTHETPLFNPVFQLSLDLSRQLEAGEFDLDDMENLIAELECEALQGRASRLRNLTKPDQTDLSGLIDEEAGIDGAIRRWNRPQMHAVFTAHPTFLMTPQQSRALAEAASQSGEIGTDVCIAPSARPAITLQYEHDRAMAAIANAQDARDTINRSLLRRVHQTWPDSAAEFTPMPFKFATWVGYDMDGRTDIAWYDSIGFRLSEKAQRLKRYVAALERIDGQHSLLASLRRAADYAQERADDFAGDLSSPEALSNAANRLTREHADKLLSLTPVIDALEDEAGEAPLDRAVELRTLAAAMRADGLGMGLIHFRVNSSQLHNAIRRRMDPETTLDLASRGAVKALRDMLAKVKPLRSNFAALAIESSTAIRQFLAMAQIIQHIDGDAPIRMLIAECEQPATVLAALYFSELFGIADKVDVSPLFETENALEHGGRFLDALLSEPAFQQYARKRGRIAIQTGFSDAGRFVGQIPAGLSIERLQGRLAQAMRKNDLTDVSALIFNTHGEGMGRGAHPGGFADRLEWPLSPWARSRFNKAGIHLEPEASFQGGDGYQFFATPELALATLTRIAELRPAEANDAGKDPLYKRTDLSLDFYRAIRSHQRDYLTSRVYSRAITAFGLGLLNETGSRKSRRQSDLAAEREMSLRQIRAIPHNAILQQLGYPVNIIAGVGTAAEGNYEDLAALINKSARGKQMIRLVRASNNLASIKTVAAYGELFNAAFWASRTYRGTEGHLSDACQYLAEYLTRDDRAGVFRRLASQLRTDALKLYRLLGLIPNENPLDGREEVRRRIGVLQAVRLALLQHMFLKAVSIPTFSRANDISRDDVLEMVFTLRIEDALAQLRRAYPTRFPQIGDFAVEEESNYPDGAGDGYTAIRRDYIDPIERSHDLNLRISAAIANEFGAHG
ncbi:phosphoenolpyruvate carboxylase [Qipengyuania atrilutea]|uniref:Phosphoenolpyruvate carboxylase n=1 Tax=Qipengyuania atrilutea TaxID=2744473 RepID=A0A850H329_9SPHN|nr:phosphoenolpyruvate carboxylase [Actirhodobacter atriluteus]NVD44977.1 phosphoenolpyruvate carboxylase [Actirhodobacter atriluteus]